VTIKPCGLAPVEPEERQREHPASRIEHAISHGSRARLRERLMILIEAGMERHEHQGERRPAPVPWPRCPCPKCPQEEAREDGIFREMRRFADEEVEEGILVIGDPRRQLLEHVPEHTTRLLGGEGIR